MRYRRIIVMHRETWPREEAHRSALLRLRIIRVSRGFEDEYSRDENRIVLPPKGNPVDNVRIRCRHKPLPTATQIGVPGSSRTRRHLNGMYQPPRLSLLLRQQRLELVPGAFGNEDTGFHTSSAEISSVGNGMNTR